MRFVHTLAAFGIALMANLIEPDWLGLVVLMLSLGLYAYFVAFRKRNK